MKTTTKIKCDRWSLFVRAFGMLWRPVPVKDYEATLYAPLQEDIIAKGTSILMAGAKVVIHQIAQTPLLVVTDNVVTEIWHTHGGYTGDDCKWLDSNEVWRPK